MMSGPTYHHGNLRAALLDAAVDAVRRSGPDGLVLRALARQVGVSHNAAYRHFADRDALVAEVGGRALAGLVDSMQRRLGQVDTDQPVLRARRRLTEVGRGYVEFATTEPGLFRLASSSLPLIFSSPRPPTQDPLALLGQVLDELVEVGFLAPHARAGAEVTCWSCVHGFSALRLDGALDDPSGTDDRELESVLATIDRSYAATTGSVVAAGDLSPRG